MGTIRTLKPWQCKRTVEQYRDWQRRAEQWTAEQSRGHVSTASAMAGPGTTGEPLRVPGTAVMQPSPTPAQAGERNQLSMAGTISDAAYWQRGFVVESSPVGSYRTTDGVATRRAIRRQRARTTRHGQTVVPLDTGAQGIRSRDWTVSSTYGELDHVSAPLHAVHVGNVTYSMDHGGVARIDWTHADLPVTWRQCACTILAGVHVGEQYGPWLASASDATDAGHARYIDTDGTCHVLAMATPRRVTTAVQRANLATANAKRATRAKRGDTPARRRAARYCREVRAQWERAREHGTQPKGQPPACDYARAESSEHNVRKSCVRASAKAVRRGSHDEHGRPIASKRTDADVAMAVQSSNWNIDD